MSSPSRACVHSACTVYIALPSACNDTTRRSGQATAAPVASGMPSPIEPPMFDSQSCGAADLVGAKKPRPVVTASSATIALSGSNAPIEAPSAPEVMSPVAGAGFGSFVDRRRRAARADLVAQPFQGLDLVLLGPRQHMPLAACRGQPA